MWRGRTERQRADQETTILDPPPHDNFHSDRIYASEKDTCRNAGKDRQIRAWLEKNQARIDETGTDRLCGENEARVETIRNTKYRKEQRTDNKTGLHAARKRG